MPTNLSLDDDSAPGFTKANDLAPAVQRGSKARSTVCNRWLAHLNSVWWAVALCLLAVEFVSVMSHAVNVPYWDDWAALDPGALDRAPNWRWIVGFHNVHRTVWTNLSIWALYRLGGWNLNAHVTLNFLMYAAFAVFFLRTLERWFVVRLGPLALFSATTIPAELHLHASNAQWTFALLFFFVALFFSVREDAWGYLGPVFGLAALYAMSTGLIASLAFLAFLLVLSAVRRSQWQRYVVEALVLVLGMVVWSIGYQRQVEPTAPPWGAAFWVHYGALLAGGTGWAFPDMPHPERAGAVVAAGLLLLVTAVLLKLRSLPRLDAKAQVRWLALLTWVLGLMLALAAVSYGRGWAGPGGALSGRYLVVLVFLVPAFWLLVRTELIGRLKPPSIERWTALIGLVLLLAPISDKFDFESAYGREQLRRLEGLRCLRRMVHEGRDPQCPDIQQDLERAPLQHRRAVLLGLSYVKEQL